MWESDLLPCCGPAHLGRSCAVSNRQAWESCLTARTQTHTHINVVFTQANAAQTDTWLRNVSGDPYYLILMSHLSLFSSGSNLTLCHSHSHLSTVLVFFFLCVCPTNTLSFLNFLFYYWSRKLISFLSLFHSFKANLPLLQRELLHCARLAKQTPAQYLAQHEQLLLDANASSPLDSSEIMLEMNEHGKRRTPER